MTGFFIADFLIFFALYYTAARMYVRSVQRRKRVVARALLNAFMKGEAQ